MAVTAFDGIVGFRNSSGEAVRVEESASNYGTLASDSAGRLILDSSGDEVRVDATNFIVPNASNIQFDSMPTSDPLVANKLWNDGGTVKVSSG